MPTEKQLLAGYKMQKLIPQLRKSGYTKQQTDELITKLNVPLGLTINLRKLNK